MGSLAIILTTFISFIVSVYLGFEILNIERYASPIEMYVTLIIAIALILVIIVYCVVAEKVDAIISNALLISVYILFCYKQYWMSINQRELNLLKT